MTEQLQTHFRHPIVGFCAFCSTTMASEAKTATPDVVDAEEENYEVHPKFLGDDIEFIARYLMDNSLARIGGVQPEVAIVCGTGLSHLSERVANKVTLPYDTIPRFPQSTGACSPTLLALRTPPCSACVCSAVWVAVAMVPTTPVAHSMGSRRPVASFVAGDSFIGVLLVRVLQCGVMQASWCSATWEASAWLWPVVASTTMRVTRHRRYAAACGVPWRPTSMPHASQTCASGRLSHPCVRSDWLPRADRYQRGWRRQLVVLRG